MLNRRTLVTGLAAIIAAPAIVRASSLMPVKAWEDEALVTINYSREMELLMKSEFGRNLHTNSYLTKLQQHIGTEERYIIQGNGRSGRLRIQYV